MYDWGIFFENGMKWDVALPFGPERPDNFIDTLSGEWFDRACWVYPNLRTAMREQDLYTLFAGCLVNPPREPDEEEKDFFKEFEKL